MKKNVVVIGGEHFFGVNGLSASFERQAQEFIIWGGKDHGASESKTVP